MKVEKEFCVNFMQNAVNGQESNEVIKQQFIASLKAANAEGFYLAFGSKKGWKLSNKNPESLARQIRDFDHMVNSLFEKVSDI